MKRRGILVAAVCVFALAAVNGTAQSNEFLDAVLAEEHLSYGSAAYLVLASAGRIDADASPGDAVSYLEAQDMSLPNKSQDSALSLGEYSYILMQVYGISGGLMYRVLPSPRYATRELAHRGIIQGRSYNGMQISAERGMRILGRVLQRDERGLL